MARKPREESAAGIYHFVTRGVNKKQLFHQKEDYAYFLELVKEYIKKLDMQAYHYCLLTNHAHLVVSAPNLKALGQFGHFVHRRYAYYYCKTHNWSEQVFRRHFRSKPIADDAYLLECGRYIERNPVEAGLAQTPRDYPHSSYRFYAEGEDNPLLTESPLYSNFGNSPSERMAAYRMYVCHERIQEVKKLTVPF